MRKPLSVILTEKSDARRNELWPQVASALATLLALGLKVRLIGSYAKPGSYFDPNSDVDLLIEDAAGRERLEISELASSCIKDAIVDVAMAADLDAATLAWMKTGVHEPGVNEPRSVAWPT